MTYDPKNVFAKILRGELSAKKIYENEVALAFEDIHPDAPVHVLVIPKGNYVSFHDFSVSAPSEFIAQFFATVRQIAEQLGLSESGYRLVTNHGPDASQSVHHFHVHILGGRPLGRLLPT